MDARVMAHMVAFYPTREESFTVAQALVEGGAAALEIQFPFSDPTADGPAIQEACGTALKGGFHVSHGLDLVKRVRELTDIPIFIMTYASVPYAVGIERFVERAHTAGATGLIVPDLPPDSDEGLYAAGRRSGLDVVPVLVPTAAEERFAAVEQVEPRYLYCALRTGTTGTKTTIGTENLDFLERARGTGAGIMAGFGVQERDQVEALSEHVDYIVVGSAIVRTVSAHAGSDRLYEAVRAFTRRLVSGDEA